MIISELASNAIEHAGTAFDVTVGYTTAYLRIAVQDCGLPLPPWRSDSATNPAALDRGRGLYIVDALATAWNTVDIGDGKIVWALLRTRPLGSPQRSEHRASEPPHRHGMAQIVADFRSPHDAITHTARLCGSRPWARL